MEILKFSEPPKRSGRSSSAKRSGLMPMVTFGIAVLVLGGMSTTLAGTISLGTNNTVEFGQGVVTTAACDTTINVAPVSTFETNTADGFLVNKIIISNLGVSNTSDTSSASLLTGCLGKTFTLRAYSATGPLTISPATGTSGSAADGLSLKLPATISAAAGGTGYTKGSSSYPQDWFLFSASGPFTALANESGGTAAGNGQIEISGIRLSKTVERITLESSS